nr:group III truncated hemoglobin [Cognatishimia sp. SS12]
MPHPMQLFEITPAEVDRIVSVFYARIRRHPELGPIFAAHIAEGDWPAHEAKIAQFWRSAILKEGGYAGNPMRVHMSTPDVMPRHFTPWLALFDEVLSAQLSPDAAKAFSALAHRIGRGLRVGLEQVRAPKDAPPILR